MWYKVRQVSYEFSVYIHFNISKFICVFILKINILYSQTKKLKMSSQNFVHTNTVCVMYDVSRQCPPYAPPASKEQSMDIQRD